MPQHLSGLIAAWLIAAVCIGFLVPLRQTVPTIEITGRTHPSKLSTAAPAPNRPAREMPFGRTDAEDGSAPVGP